MARDVESLVLTMSADIRRFERQMARSEEVARRRLTAVEEQARRSDRNLSRQMRRTGENMTASLRDGLRGLAPTLAAAFSAAQVIRYADSYTELQNRLRATGIEGERLVQIENALFEAANRNGVAIDAVAQLYQRASLSRAQLGATDEELIALTNGVSAALRVQGVSASEASGPLLQLGQALGAGTVRAEELNSLLEGTPIILQAAAAGSVRFAGDMQALASAIREGEVTSQELFRSLLTGLPELERQAGQLPLTVGQSFQVLNNELGRFVGQADSGLSATERMAQGIKTLADNLDVVVTAAGVTVALVGGRMVLALGAATIESLRYQATLLTMSAAQTNVSRTALLASASLGTLRTAALFFVTTPIGIAITAVATALALVSLRSREGTQASRDLEASTIAVDRAMDEYEEAARAAANATAENAAQAAENAARMREEARAALDSARAQYARRTAMAQAAAAEARQAARDNPIGGGGYLGLPQGGAAAVRAQAAARVAQAEADAAFQAQFQAGYRLAEIENNIRSGAYRVTPPTTPAPSGGGGSGGRARTTAEDVQRAEEEAAAYAKQKRDEAEMLAIEQQRDELAKAKEERENNAVAAMEREAAALDDRLRLEADLARLRGDPAAMERAERELFINDKINQLLAERPGLTEAAARDAAAGEWEERRGAAREGALRYEMRDAAGVFIDAIRGREDVFGALGAHFADVASDHLQDILGDLLTSLFSSQGGGSGIGGAIGGFLKGLIPGFASGTSSAPGGLAYVHKGEVLANLPKGTSVIPAHAVRAMGQMQGVQPGIGRHTVNQTFRFDLSGAVMTEDLLAQMNEIGVLAYSGAVTQTQAQQLKASRRASNRFTR